MNSTRRFGFWLAGLALVGVPAAHAQGLFRVTGVAPPGSATFESAAGERGTLGVGPTLLPGKVQVADGGQLMLFEPQSGAVAVVLGPASFVAQSDETTGGVRLELQSGKLMLAYAPGGGEARPPVVATVPSASAQIGVELLAALGRTYVYRAGDRVEVGYVSSGAQAALALSVNKVAVSLPSGHVLVIDWRGDHKIDPLGDWLARTGFDQIAGGELGTASAQEARVGVADRLFSNIIVWDLYAKAEHLVAPPTPSFEAEVRQAAVAATAIGRSTTRGGIQKTQPVAAANEVPLLSPAAASVQNVGAGVTAIQLNRNAAALLVATGSRGLGFRGPAQLAIPGFFGSGLRSVGPAGLGAR